jgi:hypothetical protein
MKTNRVLSHLVMLSFLMWCVPGLGRSRSAMEAERIANTFLMQSRRAGVRGTVLMPESSMRLYTTSAELLEKGEVEPAFYVFTPQDNDEGGFVIVSGIEEAAPILGFSYSDVFDAEQLPPAMRYLLGKYQEEIEAYLTLPIEERQHRRYARDGRQGLPVRSQGVSPMITTRWNQGSPYNSLCPKDGNERSVTGCAATSAAQVMKYYRHPSRGTGSISYVTETKGIPVSFDFSSTTFQWSRMLDSYSNGYTSSQATAVATLMAACGAAFQMDYSSALSGASTNNQMSGLIEYLGYDADMAMLWCDYMTTEQWHSFILEQLNDRHPVIFSGLANDVGHSFILDGYIDDDPNNPSYHVNWGWGGYYDDYFKVNALEPGGQGIGGASGGYNTMQQILYGCFPENNKVDHGCMFLGDDLTVSPSTVASNTAASVTITLQNIYNFSNKSFSGEFRFYLKKGSTETYLGRMTGAENVETLSGFSTVPYSATLPSNLTEGTYEVVVKTKQTGSSIEEPICVQPGNPKLVISETGVDPGLTEYAADLQTTELEIVSFSGKKIEVSVAQIMNMAELPFTGNIVLALADTQGKLLTIFGETSRIDDLGQYYSFYYPRTLKGSIPEDYCVDGSYRLYVAANQTGYSGWSYLRGYSLDGNYIVDYDRECYLDLLIKDGVIGMNSYNVSVSYSEGGRVEASKTSVVENGKVTFTIIPDDDYALSKAKLNGRDVTSQVVDYQYTVSNVNEDLLFEVTFDKASEYLANLQVTEFIVELGNQRNLTAQLSRLMNFGEETFSGEVSLALADRNDNLITVFGDRMEITGLKYYYSLIYPRYIWGTIPQEIGDGHYRLCAVAKQQGKTGWSRIKRYKYEYGSVTAYSLDCHQNIWLINGVLKIPTFTITTLVTGGGTVASSMRSVKGGESVTFTFRADEGYELTAATLNDVDILSSIVDNYFVVDEVLENLAVSATFTYSLGIEEVVCDDNRRDVVYDLQGRRVHELVPGNVYVRDGKKFFYH